MCPNPTLYGHAQSQEKANNDGAALLPQRPTPPATTAPPPSPEGEKNPIDRPREPECQRATWTGVSLFHHAPYSSGQLIAPLSLDRRLHKCRPGVLAIS